jgi:hypothetical protein
MISSISSSPRCTVMTFSVAWVSKSVRRDDDG